VVDALTAMLPEEVRSTTKKMGMDDSAKAELEAAKESGLLKVRAHPKSPTQPYA
jgi:hypothetical protein